MSAPSPNANPAASTPARLIVLGAGAIGSLFGAQLSNRLQVVLVGRAAHVDAIRAKGLQVVTTTADERTSVRTVQNANLRAATMLPAFETGDAIAVFCKSNDTAAAAEQIAAAVKTIPRGLMAKRAPVVPSVWTFQNGVDNPVVLQAVFERELPPEMRPTVHIGIATAGATLEAPGRVAVYGGHYVLPEDAAGRGLGGVLAAAGVEVRYSTDISVELWRKLALNCVVNPLTLILQRRNRFILTPELAELRAAVIREVATVGRAEGVSLDPTDLTQHMETAMAVSMNYSSMYQDRLRHQERKAAWETTGKVGKVPQLRTEIDALNGVVVRLAKKHAITVPATETLEALV
ncbi:MAG TPA: ketopantoate reductase C-terminal domain-containing protein, partial [Planctomycetota bacterium]|nr:ketopantoate reductase C-terminal domain-containing protein [Planctomycetota bacterium]